MKGVVKHTLVVDRLLRRRRRPVIERHGNAFRKLQSRSAVFTTADVAGRGPLQVEPPKPVGAFPRFARLGFPFFLLIASALFRSGQGSGQKKKMLLRGHWRLLACGDAKKNYEMISPLAFSLRLAVLAQCELFPEPRRHIPTRIYFNNPEGIR